MTTTKWKSGRTGKTGHQTLGDTEMMNQEVLERIYEEVLDEKPELDENNETRKVAQVVTFQLFQERSLWWNLTDVIGVVSQFHKQGNIQFKNVMDR